MPRRSSLIRSAPKPEFVIVDHEISPSQARNLERATGAQVLDRTGVIMEIFHRHAHSREAKLQVEIARLKYVVAAPAGVVGGRRAAAGLRRGRVRSRSRSPQDPRSPRGAERAAGGYPARQRPASVRASRSAPGRAGRIYERREVVAHACAHGQRGAGRGQALRDARHDGARAEAGDEAARARLGHGRVHQEAAARSRRVVPIHACRGARSVAAAVRRRRVRSDVRIAARGEPQRAARDRRGGCPVAPAPQQDRSRQRGRSRRPRARSTPTRSCSP